MYSVPTWTDDRHTLAVRYQLALLCKDSNLLPRCVTLSVHYPTIEKKTIYT